MIRRCKSKKFQALVTSQMKEQNALNLFRFDKAAVTVYAESGI